MSNTVWIVTHYVPEETLIDGVFASKKLAQDTFQKEIALHGYEIEEHDVID